jgi:hypothetical protein
MKLLIPTNPIQVWRTVWSGRFQSQFRHVYRRVTVFTTSESLLCRRPFTLTIDAAAIRLAAGVRSNGLDENPSFFQRPHFQLLAKSTVTASGQESPSKQVR